MSRAETRSRKRKRDDPGENEEIILQSLRDLKNQLDEVKKSRSRRRRSRRSRPHSRDRESSCSATKKNNHFRRHCEHEKNLDEEKKIKKPIDEARNDRISAALKIDDFSEIAEIQADPKPAQHAPLIDEWKRIVRQGLGAKELEELAIKYKISESSLEDLRAPELNSEVKNIVDATTIKIDDSYATRQNQSAVQMSVIEKVLGIVVNKGKQSSEVANLVENLNDIGRTNADIHHAISIARRRAIFVGHGIKNFDELGDDNIGKKLFSRNEEMLLWKQKFRLDFHETAMAIIASWKEEFLRNTRNAVATQTCETVGTDAAQETTRENSQRVVAKIKGSRGTEQEGQRSRVAKQEAEGSRIAKQEAEGARIAKEKMPVAAITPGVPSKNEFYPGVKELVKRSLQQRGLGNELPLVKDSTWKQYNSNMQAWWDFCQREKKDFAEPLPQDVIRFYQSRLDEKKSLTLCRAAIGHLVSPNISKHPMIMHFFRTVKKENV